MSNLNLQYDKFLRWKKRVSLDDVDMEAKKNIVRAGGGGPIVITLFWNLIGLQRNYYNNKKSEVDISANLIWKCQRKSVNQLEITSRD